MDEDRAETCSGIGKQPEITTPTTTTQPKLTLCIKSQVIVVY